MKLIDLFRKKEEESPVVNDTVNEDISTNEVDEEQVVEDVVEEEPITEETVEEEPVNEEPIVEEPVVEKEQPKNEEIEDAPQEKVVRLSYAELEKKYQDAVNNYQLLWNDCAYRGLPYNEMLRETEVVRKEIMTIDQEMRLIKEPSISYKKNVDGTKYDIETFIQLCNNGVLTDNNGYGIYAAKRGISDIIIYPSDIMHGRYRQDFTHVIWHDTIPFE